MPDHDDIGIAAVGHDEVEEVLTAFDRTFGFSSTREAHDRTRRHTEPERTLAARSPDGQVVGTAGAYTFDMSLPFGHRAGCAGITRVSVRADHRRRGLLTRMLADLLDDAAHRGEPLAALWASESPIYGRFGFGPAAPTVELEVDRRHARLHVDGPVDEVRLVDRDVMAAAVPDLYRAAATERPGMLSRSSVWWDRVLDDPPDARHGAGPLRYALLPGRGYAVHRLQPAWEDGVPVGTVTVEDLIALDAEANAALWRFVLDTDLGVRTRADKRPADDPLLAALVDPGRAKVAAAWPLQVAFVDLPAALEARGYATDGTCVLEVHDAFRPANRGRWRLAVVDGVGHCEPATDAHTPDVTLTADGLATLYLGGVRATQLHAAGRIGGARAAVAQLDRLLATEVAPWHGGMF